jgi:D-3-phosphoglycerate dehydrogenase / 2-oxoglutarate reductase
MAYKVLVSDSLAKEGVDIFKNAPGIEVDVKTGLKPDELKAIIGQYDALAIRSATNVTPDILAVADKMKVIGRAGIGVDNVDLPAASAKGVVVMNTPGGNTTTTAEHTIAMMMSLARWIPQATSSTKGGNWEKKKFMGTELFNKTLGVVGLGNIGSIVADRALGLKMRVLAFDPFVTQERAQAMGIELGSLDDIWARADFITVHTPLTEKTRGLLNKDTFAKMKKGVRIINCARGGIVDEKDLYDALKSGQVAGAAFDVFEKEPVAADHPLLTLSEFVVTPHLGASTDEAQVNVSVAIAEQIVEYLTTGGIRNAVNVPNVSPEALPTLRPYLTLGESMGAFQSQIATGNVSKITVEYAGDVVNLGVAAITVAVTKGFFEPITEGVNYVNAPVIARERGIEILESKHSKAEDFASTLTIRTTTDKGEHVIVGALFGKNDARIVRIDDFLVELVPQGTVILIENADVPGVIGSVGTELAKAGINIMQMYVGRNPAGPVNALSVVLVEKPLPEGLVDTLKKLPNIIDVRQAVLKK